MSQYLIVRAAIDAVSPAAGGFPDCNENGVDDAQDIANLTSPDCNGNGTPDECEINENNIAPGGPFFCTNQCDPDCNHTGVPDECELADNDCNADGRPDECGVLVDCSERTWLQEQVLSASDAKDRSFFGRSIAVDGHTAVIGSDGAGCNVFGGPCGGAYVFRHDGVDWSEVAKLTATDAAPSDDFGFSVSIEGTAVIVGAPDNSFGSCTECGIAYVYRFDGTNWIEERRFQAPNAAGRDAFGYSVSISSDTILVGAPYTNCADGSDCGAAYTFTYDGRFWVDQQTIVLPDAEASDRFGFSVSLSGDVAVVGSVRRRVHVFRFHGTDWVLEQQLTASDGESIGTSVSLSGDTIVAGGAQSADCAGGRDCGAAYVFRFDGSTWNEVQKLQASDGARDDHFGDSVSIHGDSIVVGANRADCLRGSDCGAAYIFRYDGANWIERQKLVPLGADQFDGGGDSVAISNNTVIVGAPIEDCSEGVRCGAAYAFDVGGDDCNCNGIADQCDDADCNGNGIPDVCEMMPDCDADGYTDNCEPDGDLDLIPDDCDDCPNGSNTIDSDGDGVPDGCDICPGADDAGPDCDDDGLPDACEPDGDGDGVPDDCDICPNGSDTEDSDGDGVFDGCDICPGFDDAGIDNDGDGIPDACDACPGFDDSLDADGDGVPDACDPCDNNVPGDCPFVSPILAPPPHDIRKNRYISIDPRGDGAFNIGQNLDIRITLLDTIVNGVTAVGSSWWANPPDAACISIVGSTRPAAPINWDACPTLHLTGCPIIPTSSYDIVAVVGGLASFPPMAAETQAKPGVKWWGDVSGFFNGIQWRPPNGIVSIEDAVAVIKTFQDPNAFNAAHVSVVDLHPNRPGLPPPANQINKVINFDDVFSTILGFQGMEYPGPQIELCP